MDALTRTNADYLLQKQRADRAEARLAQALWLVGEWRKDACDLDAHDCANQLDCVLHPIPMVAEESDG